MPDEFFDNSTLHKVLEIIDNIEIEEMGVILAVHEMSSNRTISFVGFRAIVSKKC